MPISKLRQVFVFATTDAPTVEDLEAQRLNQQRMQQVIQARWIAIAVFLIYGAYLSVIAAGDEHIGLTPAQVWAPLAALGSVVAYNLLFGLTYRRWSRFRVANAGQLIIDAVVVTIIVHYSGGVHSWFWAMYLLILIEAAFLLERWAEVLVVASLIWLLYGGLLLVENLGLLAPLAPPHPGALLHQDPDYNLIAFGWVFCMTVTVGGVAVVLSRLIRDREQALRKLVVRDELTGLYNRRYFFQRLRGEVARCKRYERTFSLILIDVDDFKKVNDRYGHLAGDEVLQCLGQVLGSNLRRSDTEPAYDVDVACRYGGEEFAIILPETEGEGSRVAAERIRQQVTAQGALVVAERIREEISRADPAGLHITVSLGLCTFPLHGETVDQIVAAADAALYQAKEAGKDRVVVAPAPKSVTAATS